MLTCITMEWKNASNMASYREGRQKTSIAWDHFEVKDKERGVATCNICHEGFSYRTSVSNLMKHLKNKHGYVVVKGDNDDEYDCDMDPITEGEDKEDSEPKNKEIKSELWEYFQVKDGVNKLATCSICLDQFSYLSTTANLVKHLQVKHSVDFKTSDDDREPDDGEATSGDKFYIGESVTPVTESRGRSKSSIAWEYFDIKDDERKVACCNVCGALCSYRTSVSNLMKHARRKHGAAGADDDEGNDDSTMQDATQEEVTFKESKLESSSSRSQRSIVWLYFKPLDNDSKMSQCLICKKTLSHSSTLTNLKKHLARKHPNVKIPHREDGRKRILLSSGGELYEVEAGTKFEVEDENEGTIHNETLEMDTVYLEDFELQDDEPLKKLKDSKKKRTYSSSSEEEITFINRYTKKHSDSFDHFGKYIASLLRNLPAETSSKLQADFVKQILSVEDKNIAYSVPPVTNNSQEFLSEVK